MQEEDFGKAKERLIALIDEAEIADFFLDMKKLGIKSYYLAVLNKEFISGKTKYDFPDRCKAFVNRLTFNENLIVHEVDWKTFNTILWHKMMKVFLNVMRFLMLPLLICLTLFVLFILVQFFFQIGERQNTDILFSVVDKNKKSLDSVNVSLSGGKLIEKDEHDRYNFKFNGKMPDSLYFNINIFGIDTSYTVSSSEDLSNLSFEFKNIEKEEIDGIGTHIYQIAGKDNHNRTAKFSLLILDKSYFWSIGDSVNIATDAKGTRKDVCSFLRNKY